jgi:hypothetical protein
MKWIIVVFERYFCQAGCDVLYHVFFYSYIELSGSVQCIIYRSKVCTQGIINCVEYSCSRGSIKMGEMNDTLCISSTSKMNT